MNSTFYSYRQHKNTRFKTKTHPVNRKCDPVTLHKSNPMEDEPYRDRRKTGDLRNSSNRDNGGTTPDRHLRRFDNSASPWASLHLCALVSHPGNFVWIRSWALEIVAYPCNVAPAGADYYYYLLFRGSLARASVSYVVRRLTSRGRSCISDATECIRALALEETNPDGEIN